MGDKVPDAVAVAAAIAHFRRFLNDSWPSLDAIMMAHDWDDDPYALQDWLDDNWKHLFARQLLGMNGDLQPLSIGVDEIRRHRHRYQLRTCMPSEAVFVTLGTSDRGFSVAPPFDQAQVLTEAGEVTAVPLSALRLELFEDPQYSASHGT